MTGLVKVVLDCETAGKPDEALARRIFDEAMALQAAGEEEKAVALLRTAQETLQRSAVATEEIVPLSPGEIVQKDEDDAAAAAAVEAQRVRARLAVRAKRDRLLAQTDVFALPDAALPEDLPAAVRDAITNNRAAWRTFRQQLRDYMATVDDPHNPPAFPDPPADPPVILT